MDPLIPIGLSIAGFVLGSFVFSRVGHWLVGIHAVFKRSGATDKAALASAVLAASGPWVLAVVGFLAFQVHGQPWALWLFGGMVAAILCFGVLTVYMARKAAASKKSAA